MSEREVLKTEKRTLNGEDLVPVIFTVDEEGLFPADGPDWDQLHFRGVVGHDEGLVYCDDAVRTFWVAGGVEVGGHFCGVDIADCEGGGVEGDGGGTWSGRRGSVRRGIHAKSGGRARGAD